MEINILRMNEERQIWGGRIDAGQHTIIYSGGDKHERDIVIIF